MTVREEQYKNSIASYNKQS